MTRYPEAESDIFIESYELLRRVTAIFQKAGMSAADAALLSETLVQSDLRGVHSHGTLRVPDYVAKLTKEGVDPRGRPRIARRSGAALVVDGGNAMGQIGGTFAMDAAIAAAAEHGIGFAALENSNHCGAMDWYAMRASASSMIGLCGTNALPTMAPVGGKDKIVGINPLGIAFPAGRHADFVLDFSFGASAHGKIRVHAQKGHPIPPDWAFDAQGEPTTDAERALAGLIQPIGGHKGVALGMAVGMLSTLLTGAGYGTRSGNMVDGAAAGRDGQFFAAIDISAFTDPAAFRSRVDDVIDEVHRSARRPDVDRLLVPGETENETAIEQARSSIRLAKATFDQITEAARALGA